MTIQDCLQEAKKILSNSSTALLDAELILCHVLDCRKTHLISYPEQELSSEKLKTFQDLLQSRKAGKPVEHITHKKEFYGREFFIDERALIPRPETEEMVEDALQFLKEHPELQTVIDLGTGSGCIAITISLELPQRKVVGLEISPEALEIARINAERYQCGNLSLAQSDLFSELPSDLTEHPLVILANLPYIGTKTNAFVSDETDEYEPHLALYGGLDGLELYRKTWQQIKENKLNTAALFMEIGFSQAEQMEQEARKAFPEYSFELKQDLAGFPRTAVLLKREEKRSL